MKEASFFVVFFFIKIKILSQEFFFSKHLIFFLNEISFLRENSFYLPYFHADVRVVFSSL